MRSTTSVQLFCRMALGPNTRQQPVQSPHRAIDLEQYGGCGYGSVLACAAPVVDLPADHVGGDGRGAEALHAVVVEEAGVSEGRHGLDHLLLGPRHVPGHDR